MENIIENKTEQFMSKALIGAVPGKSWNSTMKPLQIRIRPCREEMRHGLIHAMGLMLTVWPLGERDSSVLPLAHYGVGYRNGTYQFACGGEYLYVPHVTGAPQVYGSGNTAHGVSVVSAGDMVA